MQSKLITVLLTAGSLAAAGGQGHGAGNMDTKMGPVAFLWPASRPWSAAADNTSPCGSAQGVANRTQFPLSAGSVSLFIATEASNVNFSLSYSNDPRSNSDFTQQAISHTVGRVESGHQCYKLAALLPTTRAGDNATIQLAYRARYPGENNGNDQTFYACADIQFVETSLFRSIIPCFNATENDFGWGSGGGDGPWYPDSGSIRFDGGASPAALSTGAIAGIAVGSITGSAAMVALGAFLFFRRRRAAAAARKQQEGGVEAGVPVREKPGDTASTSSNASGHQRRGKTNV